MWRIGVFWFEIRYWVACKLGRGREFRLKGSRKHWLEWHYGDSFAHDIDNPDAVNGCKWCNIVRKHWWLHHFIPYSSYDRYGSIDHYGRRLRK